ncbi:cobalamin-5'-phosphate synthase [Alteribacillus iranensis]|uniref:Adenosylcobinamide-GDP ribazoletransferase n=2 Tax=Alteribacillus iranensis TaxID=930128 RepID=A0A1I1ZR64_9BACI|nr:cobalamin-5'-phosphate synthase [Alteribacillus iranensis]
MRIVQSYVYGFYLALSFLTILPTRHVNWDGQTTRKSVYFFPVCGLLMGTVVVILSFGITHWSTLPAYITAFIIFVISLLLYGGLHLDGWMDVSDAVGSWRSREKKLEIMKDSHVGSTAVWSTFLLLSGRFLGMMYVVEAVPEALFFLLLFIPVVSRTWMSYLIIAAPLAKSEGLAAWFQKHTYRRDAIYVLLISVGILFGTLMVIREFYAFALYLFLISAVTYVCLRTIYTRIFGGVNGDMAGATTEGMETVLWMSSVLYYSFGMG